MEAIRKNDGAILRDLAKRTLDVARQDVQDARRKMWTQFNSLETRHVPVYILDPQGMWREVYPEKNLRCENPFFRRVENWLRLQLYHASLGDDFITEPWITARPVYANDNPYWDTWGVKIVAERISETMAYHLTEPTVTKPEDIARLITPRVVIDEEKTREKIDLLEDAVGDILPVIPDFYPPNVCSLSYTLAYLLGPEQMMYQMYDRPAMVHELSSLLSRTSMEICDQAEREGWFTNCNFTFMANAEIQAMPYCRELTPPGPLQTVPMKDHWVYDCSQEFESVGPEMYHEFVLSYMIPLYERFGLTAYGCCENLTRKIPYLKKIPNLRRVAVTPWADPEQCARQLTDRYVVSWRPNPAEMVTTGFDVDRIQRIVKNAKRIFDAYGCFWEVNLKDFLSVEYDERRLENWVRAVREALAQ